MSRGTLDPAVQTWFSLTGLSPSLAGLSRTVLLTASVTYAVRTPACTHAGLGSSVFARRYSQNRYIFFLFLRLLRCFSSPGSLRIPMDSEYGDGGLLRRVSPFRHLRVKGYLLLTAAFRSLSRLSSALSAKASSLRSLQLNLQNSLAILVWSVLHSVALQTWLFLNCFVFPLMLLNGLGCLLFLMIGMLLPFIFLSRCLRSFDLSQARY